MSTKSAIDNLAGILGGPVVPEPAATEPPAPKRARPQAPQKAQVERHVEIQPLLIDEPNEQSDRITVILPISLLTQLDGRVAALRRKKKVSVSGYIEAALRELLAVGDRDLEALERHRIKARRTVARVR